MNRLRTNTKEYKQKIEEYILSCIESEEEELTTPKQKIEHFFFRFENEYGWQRKFASFQQTIAEYLMGLPFNFAFMNYRILELAKNLHNVSELTEKEEETILKNYWNHLALHLLRLADKYEVTT